MIFDTFLPYVQSCPQLWIKSICFTVVSFLLFPPTQARPSDFYRHGLVWPAWGRPWSQSVYFFQVRQNGFETQVVCGLPRWHSAKEPASQCRRRRRCGFDPWRRPWRRKWQPTPEFLPGKSHGQRSLAGSVHEVTKSWTWLSMHTHTHTHTHVWVSSSCFLFFFHFQQLYWSIIHSPYNLST